MKKSKMMFNKFMNKLKKKTQENPGKKYLFCISFKIDKISH